MLTTRCVQVAFSGYNSLFIEILGFATQLSTWPNSLSPYGLVVGTLNFEVLLSVMKLKLNIDVLSKCVRRC